MWRHIHVFYFYLLYIADFYFDASTKFFQLCGMHYITFCTNMFAGAPDIFVAFSGIIQDDLALVLGYVG